MMPVEPDGLEQNAIDAVRRYGGSGMLPAAAQTLGLDAGEYWGIFPGPEPLAKPILARDIPPLLPELVALLWSFRATDAVETRVMAGAIACACFGSRHLWEDLGLVSRSEATVLIERHFPQLARGNVRELKWKHFIFERLGEYLKLPDLYPPGCPGCDEFSVCFPGRQALHEHRSSMAPPSSDSSIHLGGSIWMKVGSENLGGRGRIELLGLIAEKGSITQAAKAIGMSYKAAWDAVNTMNNLAGSALVERSSGGKGGGSTRLTARGLALIERFKRIEAVHQRFVQALNEEANDLASDLSLLRVLNMKTSARNHFSGSVRAISRGMVNDEVELCCSSGITIVATVTRESVESLDLKVGTPCFALVKASSIIIASDLAEAGLSARNQLKGTVTEVIPGVVNSEIVLELEGGAHIAAIVTETSVGALGLEVGKQAAAIFKASSVILGTMS